MSTSICAPRVVECRVRRRRRPRPSVLGTPRRVGAGAGRRLRPARLAGRRALPAAQAVLCQSAHGAHHCLARPEPPWAAARCPREGCSGRTTPVIVRSSRTPRMPWATRRSPPQALGAPLRAMPPGSVFTWAPGLRRPAWLWPIRVWDADRPARAPGGLLEAMGRRRGRTKRGNPQVFVPVSLLGASEPDRMLVEADGGPRCRPCPGPALPWLNASRCRWGGLECSTPEETKWDGSSALPSSGPSTSSWTY